MKKRSMKSYTRIPHILVALALTGLATGVQAAQYARPSGTVSSGNWTPSGAGSLHAAMDEVTTNNDTDYANLADDGAGTMEVNLSAVTDPAVGSGHIMRFRAKAAGSKNPAETVTWTLYQGTTQIANRPNNTIPRGSYQTVTYTLSAAQADLITDYSNLRFRFTGAGIKESSSETIRITWCELEVPDAAAAVAPTVTTPTFTALDTTTATLGGNITDTGGENPNERGVYWDTTSGFTAPGGTQGCGGGI